MRGVRRIRVALDRLLPAACVGCRRSMAPVGPPFCDVCRHRLPKVPVPRCGRCGEPGFATPSDRGCGFCADWPDELVAAVAPHAFDGTAAALVRAHKYARWRTVVPVMADAMARSLVDIRSEAPHDDELVLAAVPLSPARLRERGFNQADDLADALARSTGTARASLLVRGAGAVRQAGADSARREENVQGRFSPAPRAEAVDPAETTVVLVDDVLTTGSTILACVAVLRATGFRRIAALTFARTLRASKRPPGNHHRYDRGKA